SAGAPRNTFTIDKTPSAYGSVARCRVRRSVAPLPNSASATTAARANLPEQRHRQAPLFLEAHRGGSARGGADRASATLRADTAARRPSRRGHPPTAPP